LLLAALLAVVGPPQRFIVLSEFQVWADAVGPQVFKELNRQYIENNRSHVFNLYPRYENFVWEFSRMKKWVDEALALRAFNVFCIGDDTMTAQGRLFDNQGVNPKLDDFLFKTVAYAHQQGLMVAIEPAGLPKIRDKEHFIPWFRSWIGPQVPAEARADIIKLSIEWFGAYNAMNAEEVSPARS
jgi:hypothetical protein